MMCAYVFKDIDLYVCVCVCVCDFLSTFDVRVMLVLSNVFEILLTLLRGFPSPKLETDWL